MNFRKIENLHIVFWLFKDASWAANIKWLGITMILPTLSISIYLLYKNWLDLEERYHNAAVSLWIFANSLWMMGEFFHLDEHPPYLRRWCLLPFGLGITIILYYYLFIYKKEKKIIVKSDQ